MQCDICHKNFISKEAIRKHVLIHVKVKPYQCLLCLKTFVTRKALEGHQDKKMKFLCKICEIEFPCLSLLENHKKERHNNEFECETCRKFFENSKKLSIHRKIHRSKRKLVRHHCESCEKSFCSKTSLKNHQIVERHGVMESIKAEVFHCEQCPKTFRLSQHLKSHQLNIHIKKKLFPCPKCKTEFSDVKETQRHFKDCKKVVQYSYECDLCEKKFQIKSSVREHIMKFHNNGKYCCFKNKKLAQFSSTRELFDHQKIHIGPLQFKCLKCKEIFKQFSFLENHVSNIHKNWLNDLKKYYGNDKH